MVIVVRANQFKLVFDNGVTYIASMGLGNSMYLQLAGSASNEDFVKHVYQNVLGHAPTAAESQPFVAMLNQGTASKAALAVMAAETDMAATQIGLVGLT